MERLLCCNCYKKHHTRVILLPSKVLAVTSSMGIYIYKLKNQTERLTIQESIYSITFNRLLQF